MNVEEDESKQSVSEMSTNLAILAQVLFKINSFIVFLYVILYTNPSFLPLLYS